MRLSFLALSIAAVLAATSLATNAADLRYGAKDLPAIPGNPYTDHIAPGNPLWPAMFDGLTRIDRNGAVAPALAIAWKPVEATAWQFTLRRGVVFTNGEPFNARAVVAAFEWLRTPDGMRTVVGYEMRGILGAEAVEDDIVLIRTSRPDAILPARLADVMIVAPEAWASVGPEVYARNPAGTGPFVLKESRDGSTVLEAHPNSWRKPSVDRLILRVLPDRARALRAGEIDIAADLAIEDIEALDAADLLTAVAPPSAVRAIVFNSRDEQPALRDVRVRQALNHAVDKGAIDKALRGLAPAAGQPTARAVRGHDPDVAPFAYDVAKAKTLLDEAGFGDGFTLSFAWAERAEDRVLVDAITRGLGAIGVKVDWQRITSPDRAVAGHVDGVLSSFESAPTNDAARAMETGPCVLCDAAVSAKLVASNEQMNVDKRAAELNALARLYRDAAPVLYLNEQPALFGVSRKVEGFALANHAPVFERITLRN